ncbi:hypothetical protein [Algicella marina]|uniref:Sulfotransferase family protein n=1 Tax=Algicella marina TaxID=2683284 RepID=A0A6P1SZT2_9RHOB|nr:hypothetical protein [Algicella marina]QHQ34873.1 hypothetical protein GO499_06490 [Algicella marina]
MPDLRGPMIVNFDARLAFIAQTKCGSTSIENALRWHSHIAMTGHPKVTHMHMFQYRRFITPYLEFIGEKNVETTCLFRYPTDWLRSWWKYFSQTRITGEGADTGHLSFEQFITEYLDGAEKPYLNFGKQSGMLPGYVKPIAIDHLFRYEDMGRFVSLWEERLGVQLELQRHNVSPDRDGQDLSAATRARLEEALAGEFDIWENRTVGHLAG